MHGMALEVLNNLRGGRRSHHLALAILVGLLAGFFTGWNYSFVAMLLLAMLLNVNGATFAFSWLGGMVLSKLLAGPMWQVGYFLLERTFVGSLVAALGDGPVVALLNWDCYALVGGAATAVILAVPLAHAARTFASSPFDPSYYGGYAGTQPIAIFRRWGWAMAAVSACVAALLPGWLGPRWISHQILDQLSVANLAEVTAKEMDLDFWSGELSITDLRVANAGDLSQDRFRIQRLKAQLHPGRLLRGKLHIDRLTIEDVCSNVVCRAPNTPPVAKTASTETTPTMLTEARNTDVSTVDLNGYLKGQKPLADRLEWLPELINAAEALADSEQSWGRVRRWHRSLAGTESRAQRSELGQPQPVVLVRRLRAENLPEEWGLGPKALLEIDLISSDTAQCGPTHLEMVVPKFAARLSVELNLHQPQRQHRLQLQAFDLEALEVVDQSQLQPYLNVSRGDVSLQGEGWVTAQQLHLVLHADVNPLEAYFVGNQRIAGLEPSLWNEGLRRLGGFRAEALLAGTWSSPLLSVEPQAVVEQLKHQLRSADEDLLLQAVDEQLASSATPPAVAPLESPSHNTKLVALTIPAPTPSGRPIETRFAATTPPAAIASPRVGQSNQAIVSSMSDPSAAAVAALMATQDNSPQVAKWTAPRINKDRSTSHSTSSIFPDVPPKQVEAAPSRPTPGPINLVTGFDGRVSHGPVAELGQCPIDLSRPPQQGDGWTPRTRPQQPAQRPSAVNGRVTEPWYARLKTNVDGFFGRLFPARHSAAPRTPPVVAGDAAAKSLTPEKPLRQATFMEPTRPLVSVPPSTSPDPSLAIPFVEPPVAVPTKPQAPAPPNPETAKLPWYKTLLR